MASLSIEIHQHCYAQNGVAARPTHIQVPEKKENPAPALRRVREAQRLLWLSGKTRPDLAAAVQRMSSKATRNLEWVLELGATRVVGEEAGLRLPVDDAPGGWHPVWEEQRSVTGIMLLFAGCPAQQSKKQSLVALSTAEAELTAPREWGYGAWFEWYGDWTDACGDRWGNRWEEQDQRAWKSRRRGK